MTADALFELVDFEETRPTDTLPCLHRPHELEHYDECLDLVCPICGMTERSAYALMHDHEPYSFGHVLSCNVTQALIDQAACCIACRELSFGHEGGCIWESCDLFQAGHKIDHAARETVPCAKDGCPATNSRRVHRLGAW